MQGPLRWRGVRSNVAAIAAERRRLLSRVRCWRAGGCRVKAKKDEIATLKKAFDKSEDDIKSLQVALVWWQLFALSFC